MPIPGHLRDESARDASRHTWEMLAFGRRSSTATLAALVLALAVAACTSPSSGAEEATAEMITSFDTRSLSIADWLNPTCVSENEDALQGLFGPGLITETLDGDDEGGFGRFIIEIFALEPSELPAWNPFVDAFPLPAVQQVQWALLSDLFDAEVVGSDGNIVEVEVRPTELSTVAEPIRTSIEWERLDGNWVLADCGLLFTSPAEVAAADMLAGFEDRSTSLQEWVAPRCNATHPDYDDGGNPSVIGAAGNQLFLTVTYGDFTDEDFAQLYATTASELPGVAPFEGAEDQMLFRLHVALASGLFTGEVVESESYFVDIEVKPTERSTVTETTTVSLAWQTLDNRWVLDGCYGF